MMPSREHFLLKRRNALSTFSFSPTLTVDIPLNPPSPQALFGRLLRFLSYSVIISAGQSSVKSFTPFFPTFFPDFFARIFSEKTESRASIKEEFLRQSVLSFVIFIVRPFQIYDDKSSRNQRQRACDIQTYRLPQKKSQRKQYEYGELNDCVYAY